ncbi:MAG: fatty-acid desaturase [Arenicella sp.]|jgi:fatty-acid desaturase
MAFIDRILHEPSYGWQNETGELVTPTSKVLFEEAFDKTNIFKSRKNWLPASAIFMIACLLPFFYFFVTQYLNLLTLSALFFYAMIVMSTHGTIWYHRYCTHKSYTFSHPIWRFITQNLVIRTMPEEVYVISHHVHHVKSDEPGDPYNSKAGFLYCMLSDFNHQSIARDLDEQEYGKLKRFLSSTGVQTHSYKNYQKWGTLATPLYTFGLWAMNWAFWIAVFYAIGGAALVCATFSGAMFWYLLVRAFNYTGHGKGKVAHKDGIDFDRRNLSINQTRPGLFSGEWHNNHHLYPNSARAGFLPYQIDTAWIYIYCLSKIGAVSSYKDSKKEFLEKYIE